MKKTLLALGMIGLLASCSGYENKRGWGDAPIGQISDRPWDIQNAPDQYGNIATVCLEFAPGWRAFAVTADVQPVYVRDETCK